MVSLMSHTFWYCSLVSGMTGSFSQADTVLVLHDHLANTLANQQQIDPAPFLLLFVCGLPFSQTFADGIASLAQRILQKTSQALAKRGLRLRLARQFLTPFGETGGLLLDIIKDIGCLKCAFGYIFQAGHLRTMTLF